MGAGKHNIIRNSTMGVVSYKRPGDVNPNKSGRTIPSCRFSRPQTIHFQAATHACRPIHNVYASELCRMYSAQTQLVITRAAHSTGIIFMAALTTQRDVTASFVQLHSATDQFMTHWREMVMGA